MRQQLRSMSSRWSSSVDPPHCHKPQHPLLVPHPFSISIIFVYCDLRRSSLIVHRSPSFKTSFSSTLVDRRSPKVRSSARRHASRTEDSPYLSGEGMMCIIPVCARILRPLRAFEQLPADFDCHQLRLHLSPASILLPSTSSTPF